jgi:primosomal protein N' (replication factor Y)
MRYPPLGAIVNVLVKSKTAAGAVRDAAALAEGLRGRSSGDVAFQVLGPAAAPLGRLRGDYRAQVLIKGPNRRLMREAIRGALAGRPDIARRTTVDVDPLNLM